jgi:hypothetical protein
LSKRFRGVLVLTVATALSVLPGIASADPGGDGGSPTGVLDFATQTLIGADDDLFAAVDPPSAPGTTHFGPYESLTTDSGTCGIDWATDRMNRFFQIRQVGLNTFSVIEKFRDGTFSVPAFQLPDNPPPPTSNIPSPGACDNSDGTGPGTVASGIHGSFQGYLVMTITAATYSPGSAACESPCSFTDDFLASVFTGFIRHDDAFFFHYVATDQGLIFHEWKNASCARGGNHGDIQSVGATIAETASCP